jgi:hypothetical protein
MKFYTEGIDKIKVLLNPLLTNKQKVYEYFDPTNTLTLEPAGAFTALAIESEWFNPFVDYQIQIANAIYEIVKHQVLDFPDIPLLTLFCIYKNPYFFILNIVEAEFYSDFKKDKVKVKEGMCASNIDKAKELGILYQYQRQNRETGELEPTETYYTTYLKNISQFSLYNRLEKLMHDNNKASKKELLANQNEIRAEFRLDSANTNYLHWSNFKGTYQQIFKRHMNYLAVVFNNKIRGLIDFKCNENKNFKKVISIARKNDPERYAGKKLKKSYEYNDEINYPHKVFDDKEIIKRKFIMYSEIDKIAKNGKTRKSVEKINIFVENMKNKAKCHEI